MYKSLHIYNRKLKNRFDEIVLVCASAITPAVSLIANIIYMRFVNPEAFGIIQSYIILTPYFTLLGFGLVNGLNRNIALYEGLGKNEIVSEQVNAAYTWVLLIVLIQLLIWFVIAFSAYKADLGNFHLFTIIAVAVHSATTPLKAFFDTTFRASRNFFKFGAILWSQHLLTVLLPWLALFYGKYGVAMSIAFIAFAGTLVRFIVSNPFKIEIKYISIHTFKDLISSGFLVMINGYLFGLIAVSDRSVTALLLDDISLGEITLASLIFTGVRFIPISFSMLIYPKASFAYGKTGSVKILRKYLYLSILLNISFLIPIASLLYVSIGPLIIIFMPDYIGAITAAQIAAIGSALLFFSGSNISFMVMKKNHLFTINLLLALGASWIGGFYSISAGYGIEGPILARTFAIGILGILTTWQAMRITKEPLAHNNCI